MSFFRLNAKLAAMSLFIYHLAAGTACKVRKTVLHVHTRSSPLPHFQSCLCLTVAVKITAAFQASLIFSETHIHAENTTEQLGFDQISELVSAMSKGVPNWNFESDAFMANRKRLMGADQELVELLWQNGQVVLHSQGNRKTNEQSNDARRDPKHDQLAQTSINTYGSPSNLIQEDETLSWIHSPLDDSFEKDFDSNFFPELQTCDAEEKTDAMPPPGFRFSDPFEQNQDSCGLEKVVGLSRFSTGFKGASGSCNGKGIASVPQNEGKETSAITLGSSHCGSNQFSQDIDISRASTDTTRIHNVSAEPVKDDMQTVHGDSDNKKSETLEPTFTFSSGGSGSSYQKIHNKRKVREAEESEDPSEATELKSADGIRSAHRASSSRKARAAEVHNLSERRRRDRINEKMRALQELLPYSNKTDKASMLDEAIEYLKSLQLQLQVMWMGTGMGPVMYPGFQHYMPRVGMGMATPSLPHFHNPMHLPRMPLVEQSVPVAPTTNQAMMCQTPVLPSVNYQNQIQNPSFSQQYPSYMGFHLMQNPSQAMNVLSYGPQVVQNGPSMMPPCNSSIPHSERANADHPVSGKMGKQ